MILKEKGKYAGDDDRGYYGHKQEKDVAFHLRREFGESDQILIINDLEIEHRGERAQIDHLVIHPFGFTIIESKSIVGEVQVNANGEWSRSYKGSWAGIPSPIRQAELQKAALRGLLTDNLDKITNKILGLQTTVAGREWTVLCAVSSSAILHRENMPKKVSKQVVKTEFLGQAVKDLVGNTKIAILTTRPKFSKKEMKNIGDFLLDHTADLSRSTARREGLPEETREDRRSNEPPTVAQEEKTPEPASDPAPDSASQEAPPPDRIELACKSCGKADSLTGAYGQYGYYVRCGHCESNTTMKQPCPGCHSKKVRLAKKGPDYSATCQNCDHHFLVFSQR